MPVVKPEGSPALWSATTRNFFTYDLAVIWILVLINMDDMYMSLSCHLVSITCYSIILKMTKKLAFCASLTVIAT